MSSERVIVAATAPAPNSGSQTITSTNNTQPHPNISPDLVLRLRGASSDDRKVKWDDDVIDNETLGKKKSKICCIYHKPREFGESSSESDSSSSDEDDSDVGDDHIGQEGAHAIGGGGGCGDHDHDHGHKKGKGKARSTGRQRKNAYEIQPTIKSDKSGQ